MQEVYHILIDSSQRESGTANDFYINIQDSLPANIKTWDVKLMAFTHRYSNTTPSWTTLIIKSSLVPGVVGSGKNQLKNNLLGIDIAAQLTGSDIPFTQPTHRIEKPVLNNIHIQLIASDFSADWGVPKFGSDDGNSTTLLLEFKPVYQDDIQDKFLDSQKKVWKGM